MPVRTLTTAPLRAVAVVGLTALAVALTGSPAFAVDGPLPQLETVTTPVPGLLSPSPSPSPSTDPLPVPVPEPLAPVVDPIVEALTGGTPQEEPVAQQGSAPRPVAAPRGTSTAPKGSAATGGTGSASLGALRGADGLRAGVGTADVPALGAPMIAAAPRFTLPGLPVPETAPATEVAASRPASTPGAPAGLPALVVVVAAVVLVAAGAGQAAEMRARRATAGPA